MRPYSDLKTDDIQWLLVYIQNLLYKIEKFGLRRGYDGYPIRQLQNLIQYKTNSKRRKR